MEGQNTTIQTRAVGLALPSEMQLAQNRFAVAIKNHTENPNEETSKELENAQAALYEVEDLYREGRKLLLAHTWGKNRKQA